MDIRAFIFDLDGVITDTAEFHYLSWQRLADEEGLTFSREENEALRGLSRRDSLLRLLKGKSVDEATMQVWMARKQDYYLAYLETLTPEHRLPGVGRFLQEACQAGIKTAIGSASKNAHVVLDKLQLLELLDIVGDGNSVVNAKPAPDIFIWVAGRLNLPPTQVVVFEDAEAGIEAALRGGFYAVGLGSANVSKAHLVLPDLANAHVEDVLAHLRSKFP
jgi:beta-phosphoglucomutase